MFTRLDTDGDRRLGFEEFKQAVPVLNQWGIKVTNPQESFKEIDSDGGGKVLFDEFCVWAANKNLDIDDDDDFSMSSEDAQKLTNSDIKIKSEQKTEGFKNQNTKMTDDKISPESTTVDWADIRSKLPMEKTAEHKTRRKVLFNHIDNNGNG